MQTVDVGPPVAPKLGIGWRAAHPPVRQHIPQYPCNPSPGVPAHAHHKTASRMPQTGRLEPSADSGRRRSVGVWHGGSGGTTPRRRWARPGVWRPERHTGLHRVFHKARGCHATGPVAGRGTLKAWPGQRSSGSLPKQRQQNACTPRGSTPLDL